MHAVRLASNLIFVFTLPYASASPPSPPLVLPHALCHLPPPNSQLRQHAWIATERALFGKPGGEYDWKAMDAGKARKRLAELQSQQDSLGKKINKKVMGMFEKAEQEYQVCVCPRSVPSLPPYLPPPVRKDRAKHGLQVLWLLDTLCFAIACAARWRHFLTVTGMVLVRFMTGCHGEKANRGK